MINGRYVVFEGIDGAGKSSVLAETIHLLKSSGIPCFAIGQFCWLDPGSTRIIIDVREHRREHPQETIETAYFRDRVLQSEVALKKCLRKYHVLADRSVFSDAVYNEILRGHNALRHLERHVASGTRLPDLIVLVEASVEVAIERILQRGKRLRDYETPEQLKRMWACYRKLLIENDAYWIPPIIRVANEGTLDQAVAALSKQIMPYLDSPAASV